MGRGRLGGGNGEGDMGGGEQEEGDWEEGKGEMEKKGQEDGISQMEVMKCLGGTLQSFLTLFIHAMPVPQLVYHKIRVFN